MRYDDRVKRRAASLMSYGLMASLLAGAVFTVALSTGKSVDRAYCLINENVAGRAPNPNSDQINTECPSQPDIILYGLHADMRSQYNYAGWESNGSWIVYPTGYGYALFKNIGDLPAKNLSFSSRFISGGTDANGSKMYGIIGSFNGNSVVVPAIDGVTTQIWNIAGDQTYTMSQKPQNPGVYSGQYPFCDQISQLEAKKYCVMFIGGTSMASLDDHFPLAGVVTGTFYVNIGQQQISIPASVSTTSPIGF